MKKPAHLWGLAGLVLLLAHCRVDFDAVEENVREARRGLSTFEWRDDSGSLKVSFKGRISLNEDESDVVISEPESFLKIEHSAEFRWTYDAVAGADGVLRRTFTRDGQPVAAGAESDRWLREILPVVLRQTGLDARARVERLLASGGWDALAAEMEGIRSGSVLRTYIEEFLSRSEPSLDQARLLARLAAGIEGSAEAERVAEQLVDLFPEDADLTMDLVEVLSRIRSAGGRVRITEFILSNRRVGEASALKIAGHLAEVRSSSDRASGLAALADAAPTSQAVRLAMLDAAATIRSSSDQVRALRRILDGVPLDRQISLRAAEIMGGVRSSADRAAALRDLIEKMPLDPEVLKGVLEATRSLSASNREQVLLALLRRDFGRSEWETILEFVRSAFPAGNPSVLLQQRITRRLEETS